jgi:hypothetical protein
LWLSRLVLALGEAVEEERASAKGGEPLARVLKNRRHSLKAQL